MENLKYFMDTHDTTKGTFPEGLSEEELAKFYEAYIQACKEEHVTPLQTHVNLDDGRAFCYNMAPSMEAVKRVHDRVGLPYDSITEVETFTATDS